MERNPLTQEIVRKYFEYTDGKLVRRIATSNNTKVGETVGTLGADGYLFTRVQGVLYLVHRIIFLYHHGYLPDLVDHKDTDKLNNRIENLRPLDKIQNGHNSSTCASNSGYRGVHYAKDRNKYRARLKVNYKEIVIGYFDTPEEASRAYENKRKEIFSGVLYKA